MAATTYACAYRRDPDSMPTLESQALMKDPYVQRALRAYGKHVELTNSRPAASLEARSEATFWQGRYGRGWFERVMVFGSSVHQDCEAPFFGFFHMRDKATLDALRGSGEAGPDVPTVAECYLTLPPVLRRKGYTAIAGPYTTYYGVLPLEVTPMVFPHKHFAGLCGHSAAHTALLLMSNRGARPLALFELSMLFCGASTRRNAQISARELSLKELATGLRMPETGIKAKEELYRHSRLKSQLPSNVDDPRWMPEDLRAILTDCVASGLPMIVAVDFSTWVKAARKHQSLPVPQEHERGTRHVVVLVGSRNLTGKPDQPSLLFHDSNLGPWIEVDAEGLAEAATAHLDVAGEKLKEDGFCHMVAPLPTAATCSPLELTSFAMELLQSRGIGTYRPAQLRRVLLTRYEMLDIYYTMMDPKDWDEMKEEYNSRYGDVNYLWRVRPHDRADLEVFVNATMGDDALVLYRDGKWVAMGENTGWSLR